MTTALARLAHDVRSRALAWLHDNRRLGVLPGQGPSGSVSRPPWRSSFSVALLSVGA